jgi:transcriptional regulator with XRE-family HTH domain
MKEITQFLITSRKKAHLSQFEVAKDLGYTSAQFVSNWERGLSIPPRAKLKRIAKLYNLEGDKLNKVVALARIEEYAARTFKAYGLD